MKTLIFIKTNILNEGIISEFNKLRFSLKDNEKAILFIDNHKNFIETGDNIPIKRLYYTDSRKVEHVINCLFYDENVFNELNLPYFTDNSQNNNLTNVMCYNNDYPLYAIRQYFPDYDNYWLIENQVYCNGNSYRIFFDKYKSDADLIIADYCSTASRPDWVWKEGSDWIYKKTEKFASLFSILRVSAKAVDFLYARRLEHAKIFENAKHDLNNRWIFSELFIPTELTNNGFICQNLDTECLRCTPVYDLNRNRIFEHPDFKLYYPVKPKIIN